MVNPKLPAGSGIYTLIIDVAQPVRAEVGKLGFRSFDAGFYTYTGSAIGGSMNLRARVGRHLTFNKKRRWHIDYLLSSKSATVKAVVCAETHLKRECQIAKSLERLDNVKVLIKSFGSSDCHNGCESHLHYFHNCPIGEIRSRVAKAYNQVFDSPLISISHVAINDRD